MWFAEEPLDVASRDLGEVLPLLVGRHKSLLADRTQQAAGQRTRSCACLDDASAGEDVGEGDDLRRVLRVDDGGAARHRQHVVRQQRPEGDVRRPPDRRDDAALRPADQLVVGDNASMGVELLAGDELDRVHPPLRVGQLHEITRRERTVPSSFQRRPISATRRPAEQQRDPSG